MDTRAIGSKNELTGAVLGSPELLIIIMALSGRSDRESGAIYSHGHNTLVRKNHHIHTVSGCCVLRPWIQMVCLWPLTSYSQHSGGDRRTRCGGSLEREFITPAVGVVPKFIIVSGSRN